ncbi:MAG: exopolysaccharide biosynthesis protein [Roseovarius sp.]|uniref:exopolysaccharide biosynthesis protein n=1 Tax=Roseobacteraceae TaxID=2854170 RepID=UPI0032EB895E
MHAQTAKNAADRGSDTVVTIVDTLDDMTRDRDSIPFGDMVEAIGAQGYGPLLLGLSALLVLPFGMIPGVGGAIGLVMAVIGVQILRGRRGLWLPGFIRRREMPARLLHRACSFLRPRMQWLRRHLRPRATTVAEGSVSLRIIAVLLILMGLSMTVLGAIPILPPLMGIPVLFFALGLTTRDGMAVALGYLLLLPPAYVATTM